MWESDGIRFERILKQGVMRSMEIWVDKKTGVNYLFCQNGNAGGLTPLLDADGKPVVSSECVNGNYR
jgi:hypothetical protein